MRQVGKSLPKGRGNGLRAENDKGSDKIWESENGRTTQGLERVLRERSELSEVLVKVITGNKNWKKIFPGIRKVCRSKVLLCSSQTQWKEVNIG